MKQRERQGDTTSSHLAVAFEDGRSIMAGGQAAAGRGYWTNWKVGALLACAAAIIGAIAVFALGEDKTPVSTTETRALTAEEQTALMRTLATGLNDPATIQWHWLPLNIKTFTKNQGRYCGYLNAKDSFGKQLGFQGFLAAVRTTRGRISSGELALLATDDEALQVVRRMCAEAGYNIQSVDSPTLN